MKNLIALFLLLSNVLNADNTYNISGKITTDDESLPYVNVYLKGTSKGAVTREDGGFIIENVKEGNYTLIVSYTGFKTIQKPITLKGGHINLDINLVEDELLDEIVITGTLKPVTRLESPVPVEVYSPTFLKKNPAPNIFESLQAVNGVRPQINCSVCNTGDIHINGLEGPYTLVLIDGMPIVSGLSTVYGLSGIPSSLIEQVEIVKGPASSLYGSEAVGGLINVITKLPENAPLVFVDSYTTDWEELNVDLGFKANVGKKATMLLGANYFNYSNPIDANNDNFTDVTLQDRISVFQKWDFKRQNNRAFSLAGRFFYEDRWGGEMQWTPEYRGGSDVYGESIYTTRYELIGKYQLPIQEKMMFQFSYSDHDQNSAYGNTLYLAQQRIGFGQLTWDISNQNHDWLLGVSGRYNYYNDNTPVTEQEDEIVIPSLFLQDEIKLNEKHKVLLGARYDYDKRHGNIFTPRIAYKFKPTEHDIFRLNAGTGFRVVNLFTEEHAALNGARDVIIEEELKPERSYNVNLNYLKKLYTKSGKIIGIDASAWYTFFTNAILPDYDTNPNQVIYDNLSGGASSLGFSVNIDAIITSNFKALAGFTVQEVTQKEDGIKQQQILTEKYSGTWSVSYKNFNHNFLIDYTGNIYGPMRLPILGDLDPRLPESPIWSIQNIQITYDGLKNFEFYGGVKNLLDWTPNKGNPFIIARANDPFDNDVVFDGNGNATQTANNPYALTFDPGYIYAPNQGRRLFFGLRYMLK
ncbi:outer membrane receptor for ferrienterochelin and colicins [Mariniflexile fucanivorans]|uniref:Outer membrane receptor for ferrienterochelin and colicins n=1 Tax=Mariniflexile fucanivorans TaxID=264023 RepID=A0A4R1RRQ6_9FLAO|nr:TonB-dependent receptor [Mariniflexile fucanivorans]TCL69125.1 outer membrane receptor for ferrienterochelin and colicins [Mariniflexile fucanivorans]